MKNVLDKEFEALFLAWIKEITALYKYGLELAAAAPALVERADMYAFTQLVQKIDDVNTTLMDAGARTADRVAELAGGGAKLAADVDYGFDDSIPSFIIKGPKLSN